MKCISKRILSGLLILCLLSLSLTGCGKEEALEQPFDLYEVTGSQEEVPASKQKIEYLGAGNCQVPTEDILLKGPDTGSIKAAGAFNLTTGETEYAYQALEKIYPASTTKVLTAYLVIKKGKLKDKVTISKEAVMLPQGASRAGLNEGDEVTVEGLLYGLMMVSGNDAAKALAEYVSGSVEDFAALMNEEAKKMGATHSHFVNPHGIHDEDHYTTVYDMYLLFQKACTSKTFRKIIKTPKKTVVIHRAGGYDKDMTYETTNRFLLNTTKYPKVYKILGGKSGTTYNAGKCFVLLTENKKKQRHIFITMGGETGGKMFSFMNQMMKAVSRKDKK